MIKLTCHLVRNPALSAEEFQQHWQTTHAALIRSVPGIDRWLRRYTQRSSLEHEGWTGTSAFDGVTEQWFDSYADFEAMISDPTYRATVGQDEGVLLDMDKIVCLITEDVRVITGGDGD